MALRMEHELDMRHPVLSHIIPAGHGFALELCKGDVLRITDIEGQQVTDLLAFDAKDISHRFSRSQTKKLNARIRISTGHTLYSNLCESMLEITADTVGMHDMQFSPCGEEDNLARFGTPGERTCMGNLMEVLEPYAVPRDYMNEPFGIFFNMRVLDDGRCETHAPISKAGDYVEFTAVLDCIIGLSACPQVLNDCNAGKMKPVQVEVFRWL